MIDPMVMARLAIAPFAFLEVMVFLWWLKLRGGVDGTTSQLRVAWLLTLVSVFGVPLLQIFTYRAITGVARVADRFVLLLIIVESMLLLALAFYFEVRRRRA